MSFLNSKHTKNFLSGKTIQKVENFDEEKNGVKITFTDNTYLTVYSNYGLLQDGPNKAFRIYSEIITTAYNSANSIIPWCGSIL